MDKINEAREALVYNLKHFIGTSQRAALASMLKGEEAEGIADTIMKLKETIEKMPLTYEQDGKGMDAVVYLHYFAGCVDAWITEKDVAALMLRQHQAFGKICLTGNPDDAELGYISIDELITHGIELDLYWTPKTLKEV